MGGTAKFKGGWAGLGCVVGIGFGLLSASAFPGSMRSPQASAAEPLSDVIVILRDQMSSLPASRSSHAARAAALTAAQSALIAEIAAGGAANIHGSGLINAVAARLPASQAEKLAAHPEVLAVVPDRLIRLPHGLRISNKSIGASAGSSSAQPRDASTTSESTGSDDNSDALWTVPVSR
jgi:hypothetical protein